MKLLGCCLSSPPYTRYYSHPVRLRGQRVRHVRDSAPQLPGEQDLGYEHETLEMMETPPPEIDNIIEDPPVTSIPLSIDIIKEEILTTTNTIAENSQPTGEHLILFLLVIVILLFADNLLDDNICPMRENIQNCRIYLCRVVKNIMSIGFPCYSQ